MMSRRPNAEQSRRTRTDRSGSIGAREKVFGALADPTRRAILDGLRAAADGQPVAVIAQAFPVSRPAISKHLRILRDAGLVHEARQGRQRVHRLNPRPLQAVDDWLTAYRQFWSARLLDLKTFAEQQVTQSHSGNCQSPHNPERRHGDNS